METDWIYSEAHGDEQPVSVARPDRLLAAITEALQAYGDARAAEERALWRRGMEEARRRMEEVLHVHE
jgi:hypothetical protein